MKTGKGDQHPDSKRSFSLEDFQRDAFGLINDEKGFDESTLAEALRLFIGDLPLSHADARMFLAFADALDGPKAEWRLLLKGDKRGPRRLQHQKVERKERNFALQDFIKRRVEEGVNKKRVIGLAGDKFGLDRSQVYRRLKEARLEEQRLSDVVGAFGSKFDLQT